VIRYGPARGASSVSVPGMEKPQPEALRFLPTSGTWRYAKRCWNSLLAGEPPLLKRQINAKDIIDDLRSGNTDSELMEKYGLSSSALQAVCQKLVARHAISQSELYERSQLYRQRADEISARRSPRADLSIHVPIYDLHASATGLLRDISETGLRVAGIEATVGQTKTFQIPIDTFMQADPLLVVTRCRWVKTKGKNRRYPVAGFEIMDLSDKDRKSIREFIKLLLLSKSGEWQTLA
jgi:uncharacterized protein (DUF433 family)